MSPEWAAVIVAIISIVISLFTFLTQQRLGSEQQKQERDLSEKHSALERRLAKEQQDFQEKISETERLYSQRSQLLAIWQYISELKQVNPQNLVWPFQMF